MRTLAMILTPVACFFWYDFGYHLKLILDGDGVQYVSYAVSVTVIVGIGLILLAPHEKQPGIPKGCTLLCLVLGCHSWGWRLCCLGIL